MSHCYHHHRRLSVIERVEEEQGLLDSDGLSQVHQALIRRRICRAKWKAKLVRLLALLCACSLSVGSH